MIYDITGIVLTPGNNGDDCLGNGSYTDENGNAIECCCDECDYMMCCIKSGFDDCKGCTEKECPNYSVFNSEKE